ncbi:MAG: hypothetical protein JWO68_1984 [Actinomycetia bacterium]|nr:hypothetical protein [Actinomycetes bacterium]
MAVPPEVPAGPHDSIDRTPPRHVASVRRTVHIDSIRPDGAIGRLVLEAGGRDLLTTADGACTLDQAGLRIGTDADAVVTDATGSPPRPGLSALVGRPIVSGFRLATQPLLAPGEAGGLHAVLLDDIPVVAMISNYARLHAGESPTVEPDGLARKVDVCAGWRAGGAATEWAAAGTTPVPRGPVVPVLEHDDPLAWHMTPPLGPHTVRRRRRTDLRREGDHFLVDAMFRDVHADAEGHETVLHEYDLAVVVDAERLVVLDVVATPRVLPWRECLEAVDSASLFVGRHVRQLRRQLRLELRGPTTCTHLSDGLLGLNDLDRLIAALSVPAPT